MLRRLLWFCCITALPALAQTPADPAELQRLEAAIARVRTELAETASERDAVRAAVLASEQQILELQQQITELAARIAQRNAELQRLASQQQALEAERRQQQHLLARYLKGAWLAGNEEYLKLLLNQQDPQQGARMARYYGYFNAARAERIAAFNLTLSSLAEVGARITESTAALELQQKELADQQTGLTSSQQERQQALASLDSLLANRSEELQQLEREKVEIERLVDELRQSVVEIPVGADLESFPARRGKLAWPLEGKVLNSFGTRHALGDLTREGVTIAALPGADIRAVHHGRVVFADWFNSSGLLLIIDHGDGYMSLYAHAQDLYKAVGDWVAGGEVVAAAGNTGGQNEHALYFEIRHDGKADNPADWLLAR